MVIVWIDRLGAILLPRFIIVALLRTGTWRQSFSIPSSMHWDANQERFFPCGRANHDVAQTLNLL